MAQTSEHCAEDVPYLITIAKISTKPGLQLLTVPSALRTGLVCFVKDNAQKRQIILFMLETARKGIIRSAF